MAKLSGAAMLLLLVVPLCMYTCALLVGIQLGRALERGPPGNSGGGVDFTWRGALDSVTKELWDINVLRWRRGSRQNRFGAVKDLTPVVVASRRRSTDVGRRSSYSLGEEALESYVVAHLDRASAHDVINVTLSNETYHNRHTASPRGVISVGPWGGSGGQPFYMRGASAPRLRRIILYHAGAIQSLSCEYTLAGDYNGAPPRVAGPWGRRPDSYGTRGVRSQIDLRSGEHITAVEGTTGHFANVAGEVITSLTFRTSAGRTYGPYGSVAARSSSSHYFSVPAADGAFIVGFWGRSGWLLDAIGVYMKPSCSSSSSSDTAAHKRFASRRQGRN